MQRRELVSLLGGATASAVWPSLLGAQQPSLPVIGFLSGRSPSDSIANVAAFRHGLSEVGFIDRQNVEVDFRWAQGHYDQLPALAADLIRRNVMVIVATGGGIASGQAAKTATTTIPIVFVAGTDPVADGLVASFNKPGGNITGVTFIISTLTPKRFELLHELVPKATVIGMLANPDFPSTIIQLRDAQAAAQGLARKLIVVNAGTARELRTAFATLVQERVEALLVAADPILNAHAEQLVALAARYAIPAIYAVREHAVAGGLMSYGTSIIDAHREAGVYVGRILRGSKPADLPVMQSTRVELVINLKTANALGIVVPDTLLARADEVIE